MSNTYYLQFAQKIDRWDEALPLGNGEMGALVFGGAGKLTVSLDRGDIWDRSNSPENGAEFTYAHLKKYKDDRNTRKIAKIFDRPYSKPTPSKLPVGKIVLEFAPGAEDCFELDMQRAESVLSQRRAYFSDLSPCDARMRIYRVGYSVLLGPTGQSPIRDPPQVGRIFGKIPCSACGFQQIKESSVSQADVLCGAKRRRTV